jgi:hypothetical protein
MKILHLTFHIGTQLDIDYIFKKLGHDVTSMKFDDGETDPNSTPYVQSKIYEVTHDRAEKSWNKYKDYYNTFDGIITSDTCPVSRVFLQHNWPKLLIIWVSNRFDYAILPEKYDPEFYYLLRDIPNRKNVYIFGNTIIENIYSTQIKNVSIGDFVIKPLGKNAISENMYKTYSEEDEEIFYVPPYQNETVLLNLSEKLKSIGINNKCERFPNHISDLLYYKGVICIPYAWSTIVFFERLQLGLVTFVPTERFLIELFKQGKYWFQPPFNILQPELLQISEWYTNEHRDLMVYFDSWEDLKFKIKNTNYVEKTNHILTRAKFIENETMNRWNYVFNDYSSNFPPIKNEIYNNNLAIILTCTVYRQHIITERTPDGQCKPQDRIDSYVKSIKKWLYETSLNIVVVENSGYQFTEFDYEKELFKDRFEIISYNEYKLEDSTYLIDDYSKGSHELFSINYALSSSNLIYKYECNFIIKVTGRFYIPELENYLKQHDLSKCKALRQDRHLNSQIVGSHIDSFDLIFDKNCVYKPEYDKFENDYVEILFKDRIDSLEPETVLNCPVFNIEPTMAGCGGTVKYL